MSSDCQKHFIGYVFIEQVLRGSDQHRKYLKMEEYFSDFIVEQRSLFDDGIPMPEEYIDIYVKEDQVDSVKDTVGPIRGIVTVDDYTYLL